MSTQIRAFRPIAATTATAVTAASQTVAFNYLAGVRAVRFVNAGSDIIWVECRSNSTNALATNASVPLLPNTVEVFTLPIEVVQFSVIGVGVASTLYVTIGEGL